MKHCYITVTTWKCNCRNQYVSPCTVCIDWTPMHMHAVPCVPVPEKLALLMCTHLSQFWQAVLLGWVQLRFNWGPFCPSSATPSRCYRSSRQIQHSIHWLTESIPPHLIQLATATICSFPLKGIVMGSHQVQRKVLCVSSISYLLEVGRVYKSLTVPSAVFHDKRLTIANSGNLMAVPWTCW